MIAEMRAFIILLACGAICYGGADILRLGFYHDDWTFLSVLHFADGGVAARMATLTQGVSALVLRPTIIPIYVLEHRYFGLQPLPWQLALLAANVLLALAVYRLATRFGAPRRIALTAAILYLAYPSKDATMFWPGAGVCSISLALFLASYLAHLEQVRSGSRGWRGLAAGLLLLSLTTYELALFMIPLFLLTPASASPEAPARRRRGFYDAALVVGVLLVYKFVIAPRIPGVGFVKSTHFSLFHFGWAYLAAANATAGPQLVRYTALSAWKTLLATPWLVAASLGACALLFKREPKERAAPDADRRILLLVGAGMALLGCLPLALSDYTPTPLNHQNRINQAFLLGPVLMLTAQLSGLRSRKAELAALGAAAVFLSAHAGFASVWAESYRRQLRLRQTILTHVDAWPAETTLLVLLPERYVARKAPVFDAHWDISGAVRIWTGDAARRAMTVRPGLVTACSAEGLSLGDAVQPFSSVRLLEDRSERIFTPGPENCPELLAPL